MVIEHYGYWFSNSSACTNLPKPIFHQNTNRLVLNAGVGWLGACIGGLRWGHALGACIGGLHWGLALGACIGGLHWGLHWGLALGACIGGLHWGLALGACIGGLRWGFELGAGVEGWLWGSSPTGAFCVADTNMLVSK